MFGKRSNRTTIGEALRGDLAWQDLVSKNANRTRQAEILWPLVPTSRHAIAEKTLQSSSKPI
jgi:hypothetical protein